MKAVSLKTRRPVERGGDPSKRYMDMLVRGAAELNIDGAYLQALKDVKTQDVPWWLRVAAVNYLFLSVKAFKSPLLRRLVSKPVGEAVRILYVPSSNPRWVKRLASNLATAAILTVPAVAGGAFRLWGWARGEEVNPMLKTVMAQK